MSLPSSTDPASYIFVIYKYEYETIYFIVQHILYGLLYFIGSLFKSIAYTECQGVLVQSKPIILALKRNPICKSISPTPLFLNDPWLPGFPAGKAAPRPLIHCCIATLLHCSIVHCIALHCIALRIVHCAC